MFNRPKKLVILGNGFDLNLKIKSRFNDFIDSKYKDTKKIICKNSNVMSYNLSSFSLLFIPVTNLVIGKNYYENFINKLLNTKKSNFWVQYLLIRENIFKNKLDEWNDVEQSLYDFFKNDKDSLINVIIDLFEMECIYPYYNSTLKLKEFIDFIASKNKISKNDCYEMYLIASLISAKLTLEDKNKQIIDFVKSTKRDFTTKYANKLESFELGFDPTKNYKMLDKSKKYEIKQLIMDYLNNELDNFELEFNNYMLEELSKHDYENDSEKLLQKIIQNDKFILLDFNYTTPNVTHLKCKYIYNIHLKLSKNIKDSSKLPIIGIDDTDIPSNKKEYTFTKSSKIAQSEYNYNFREMLRHSVNEIKIFGHSLSNSDYRYFEKIFNYYDISSAKVKITLLFSSFDGKTNQELKRTLLLSFSRLLNKYCQYNNKENSNSIISKLKSYSKLSFKKI